MCGVCGVAYGDRTRVVERPRLTAMTTALTHRGPDDDGFHVDGGVGIGHRRLSIIDVSGGHQPIPNEDETIWVACNGEIYNFRELRQSLITSGHRFRTKSDTEIIVHAYEERGLDAMRDLGGMFSFALWDARERRLVLGRDRLGIKPLYYWVSAEGDLVWGSEIKAIFASGHVAPRLRVGALPELLTSRYTTGRETLFEGIHRVLPGHYLIWQDGQVREVAYWRLADVLARPTLTGDVREMTARFSETFGNAVRSHLVSDVPVGVFLSGGLDSSAVASLMREQIGGRLRTFSVGYDDRHASELGFAQAMATHLDAEHQEVVLSADGFFDALPRLVWHEDEPIAFPSSVALHAVAALASQSVKVVLTGEGSDELLAGYGKYVRTLWNLRLGRRYERLPRAARRGVAALIGQLPPESRTVRRLGRTFLTRRPDPEALFFDNWGAFFAAECDQLFSPELRARREIMEADPFARQRELWSEADSASPLTRLLYVDVQSYLQELLMKQDQMSMAASLESRVPFLDTDLVELAFQMPDEAKLRGMETKVVLREMMRERLPRAILDRPKLGFPTPVGRWLATSHWGWVEDCVLDPQRRTAHLFDPAYTKRIADEHRRGVADQTERLWPLINIELWARQYSGVLAGM